MAPSEPVGPPSMSPVQEPDLMTMASPWPTFTKTILVGVFATALGAAVGLSLAAEGFVVGVRLARGLGAALFPGIAVEGAEVPPLSTPPQPGRIDTAAVAITAAKANRRQLRPRCALLRETRAVGGVLMGMRPSGGQRLSAG